MINIWTIAKREYNLYFGSPVAYIVAFVMLLIIGLFFYFVDIARAAQQGIPPTVQNVVGITGFMLAFLTPAITTRLLAEERRLGTIELMLTAPVRDWELVVGKWLGAFLLLLTILAITLIYPIILNQIVEPGIDQGPLITGYLGLVLLMAATVSIGVFVSSLFSNQIAAFITTMGVFIFLWWIIGIVGQVTGPMSAGNEVLTYLDYSSHFYNNFVRGVIDLTDVVYYLSVTALGLLMATMSVETRRWR
jgi:ABC-2 type transport system permease protein